MLWILTIEGNPMILKLSQMMIIIHKKETSEIETLKVAIIRLEIQS